MKWGIRTFTVLLWALFGLAQVSTTAHARDGLASPLLYRMGQAVKAALKAERRLSERACMTMALYHEARGESREGQIAVAATILNRVSSRAYPDTICGVVFQNSHRYNACQFSFACDGNSLIPRDDASMRRMAGLATEILARADERGNILPGGDELSASLRRYIFVTHYHRHDVHPGWSRRLARVTRVGAHVFFRSRRVVRRMPWSARISRVRLLMQAAAEDAAEL